MKFLCPNCKAKYQVSDDKVAGRTLKMTCRQCGEPILLRGEGATRPGAESVRPPAAHAQFSAGFQQRLAGAPATGGPPKLREQWHVAINDTPVGPMERDELARKIRMGAVNGDSLAWREGFDDWLPVRQIPELQVLLRSTSTSKMRPPSMSQPGMPAVMSKAPPHPSRHAPTPHAAARSLSASPRGAHASLTPVAPQASGAFEPSVRPRMPSHSIAPRPTSSTGLQPPPPAIMSQPPVASRPISTSMQAAVALEPQASTAPQPAAAPAAVEPAAAPVAQPPPPQSVQSSTASLGAPPDFSAQRSAPSWGQMFMLVCGGAFILAVGAFLGAKVFAPAPVTVAAPAPPAAAPAPTATAAPALDLDVPAAEETTEPERPVEEPIQKLEPTETKSATRRAKTTAPATPKKNLTAAQREMLARMGGGEGSSSLATIKGGAASPAADDDSGGEGLDAQQLASVVNKGKRNLQRCYEVAMRGSGSTDTVRLDVEITVAPSGTVTRVNVKGHSLPGMDACIQNTVRTWVFPRSGSSTVTQFPLLFQPGA